MDRDTSTWLRVSRRTLAPLGRLACPDGRTPREPFFHLYAYALRVHRWLWVRGLLPSPGNGPEARR